MRGDAGHHEHRATQPVISASRLRVACPGCPVRRALLTMTYIAGGRSPAGKSGQAIV